MSALEVSDNNFLPEIQETPITEEVAEFDNQAADIQNNRRVTPLISSNYMELREFSIPDIEKSFELKTLWGTDHRLFNAPVKYYASLKNFKVQFSGNCKTFKRATCEFSDCPWELSWTLSQKFDPPAWSVKSLTSTHSEDCLKASADVLRDDATSTNLRTSDIARLILPQVQQLGEISSLRPKQMVNLIMPFIPPNKHTNNDHVRAVAKRVLDQMKGIFSQKCPTQTDFFPSSASTSQPQAEVSTTMSRKTDPLVGLEAFRDIYKDLHPLNRLIIHTATGPTGESRYVSSTLIIGPAAALASHIFSPRQFQLDGSHFKTQTYSKLPGIMKGLIVSDGNNSTYLVAISHDSTEESEASWKTFLQDIFETLPEVNTEKSGFTSDRDGGLMNNMGMAKGSWTFCYAHIKRNIAAQFKTNAHRDDFIKSFSNLVFSKTLPEFQETWTKYVQPFPELLAYLEDIGRPKFAPVFFSASKHLHRTSNSIEGLWNTTYSIRTKSFIVPFFGEMYTLTRNKIEKEVARATAWAGELTPWADELLTALLNEVQKVKMEAPPLVLDKANGLARVHEIHTGFDFTCSIRKQQCSCQSRSIFAIPCRHLIFVAQFFKYKYTFLFDPCYHSINWRLTLSSVEIPHLNINYAGLPATNSFQGAIYTATRGRKAAKNRSNADRGIVKSRAQSEKSPSDADLIEDPDKWWDEALTAGTLPENSTQGVAAPSSSSISLPSSSTDANSPASFDDQASEETLDGTNNQEDLTLAPVDEVDYIEFNGPLKPPSKGTLFPSIATDTEKVNLSVTCPRCNQSLPIFWASASRYDIFCECKDCTMKFSKTGRASTKYGNPCIKLFREVTASLPAPFQPQKPHPFPRIGYRKKRGPTEIRGSNRRIPSKGEEELQKKKRT